MDNLVTLITFNFMHDLAILKGRLEVDGIECFVKDEYTVTANPLYGPAVGGIKLQVRESDIENAKQILIELGYLSEQDKSIPNFWNWFERKTAQLPLIKNLNLFKRFLLIIIVLSAAVVGIAFFIISPSLDEVLTQNTWCIDGISFNGRQLQPNSLGIRLIMRNEFDCSDNIKFNTEHRVIFPGINTYEVRANWKIIGKTIFINHVDTLDDIYGGTFNIYLSGTNMVLESTHTRITTHSLRN